MHFELFLLKLHDIYQVKIKTLHTHQKPQILTLCIQNAADRKSGKKLNILSNSSLMRLNKTEDKYPDKTQGQDLS